jgi:hypothetical protein
MIEWKTGLKAGLISGIAYGVVKAFADFVRYVSQNASGDFSGGVLYYLAFLPLELVEGAIVGVLVGITFTLAKDQLPGKSTVQKGFWLSLIFFALYLVTWMFNIYLPVAWALPRVLGWSVLLEFSHRIAEWIIIFVSWIVLGVSLGFIWRIFVSAEAQIEASRTEQTLESNSDKDVKRRIWRIEPS